MNTEFIYIAYHKPKGIVTTTEKVEGNIIDAVNHPQNLIPVGRLDKNSEGLILLTNDKSSINKIINPEFEHEKEYVVTLNFPVRNQFLKQMAIGMDLGDAVTMPCVATLEPNTKRVFRIILKQGINRQIRRMCTIGGYQVIKLLRVRIKNITLGNLKPGQWRNLTQEEIIELLN